MNTTYRTSFAQLSIVLMLALVATGVEAAGDKLFYRFKDEKGRTVINDAIPPQLASHGYDILNAHGQVIETIPRELTDQEKKSMSAAQTTKMREAERQAERKARDELLIKTYSSTKDLEDARFRKVNEVRVRINALRGNIASMRSTLEQYQSDAAGIERDGQQVPSVMFDNMNALRAEIAESERLISVREAEIEALKKTFDEDIARFADLRKMYGRGS